MLRTLRKTYAEYFSPGTFVPESSLKLMEGFEGWADEPTPELLKQACETAKTVTERYNAKPYAFMLKTYAEVESLDSDVGHLKVEPKLLKSSGWFHLGGTVLSVEDIEKRNRKDERILLSNMRSNDMDYVIENTSSFKSTVEFRGNSVLLDPETGEVKLRGDQLERKSRAEDQS